MNFETFSGCDNSIVKEVNSTVELTEIDQVKDLNKEEGGSLRVKVAGVCPRVYNGDNVQPGVTALQHVAYPRVVPCLDEEGEENGYYFVSIIVPEHLVSPAGSPNPIGNAFEKHDKVVNDDVYFNEEINVYLSRYIRSLNRTNLKGICPTLNTSHSWSEILKMFIKTHESRIIRHILYYVTGDYRNGDDLTMNADQMLAFVKFWFADENLFFMNNTGLKHCSCLISSVKTISFDRVFVNMGYCTTCNDHFLVHAADTYDPETKVHASSHWTNRMFSIDANFSLVYKKTTLDPDLTLTHEVPDIENICGDNRLVYIYPSRYLLEKIALGMLAVDNDGCSMVKLIDLAVGLNINKTRRPINIANIRKMLILCLSITTVSECDLSYHCIVYNGVHLIGEHPHFQALDTRFVEYYIMSVYDAGKKAVLPARAPFNAFEVRVVSHILCALNQFISAFKSSHYTDGGLKISRGLPILEPFDYVWEEISKIQGLKGQVLFRLMVFYHRMLATGSIPLWLFHDIQLYQHDSKTQEFRFKTREGYNKSTWSIGRTRDFDVLWQVLTIFVTKHKMDDVDNLIRNALNRKQFPITKTFLEVLKQEVRNQPDYLYLLPSNMCILDNVGTSLDVMTYEFNDIKGPVHKSIVNSREPCYTIESLTYTTTRDRSRHKNMNYRNTRLDPPVHMNKRSEYSNRNKGKGKIQDSNNNRHSNNTRNHNKYKDNNNNNSNNRKQWVKRNNNKTKFS